MSQLGPSSSTSASASASVRFRNEEITALLRKQGAEPGGASAEGASAIRSSCDVSFVLFLEPRDEPDPRSGVLERLTDAAIKHFSPSPVLAHCELVLPPIPDSDGGRTHFATYFGHRADWQNRSEKGKQDGIAFYLVDNGSRWRALPVFGPDATTAMRDAAEANVDAPYALRMYPTSAWGMRKLAWLWGDKPKHAGHCATLTTRVLKEAGVGGTLEKPSAWYSPGTLYTALYGSVGAPLEASERSGLTSVSPAECTQTIDTLLRAPLSYATVRQIGDAACIDAVRALTLKVCATAEQQDEPSSRVAQKQLASALLRWVLLRADEAESADIDIGDDEAVGAEPVD